MATATKKAATKSAAKPTEPEVEVAAEVAESQFGVSDIAEIIKVQFGKEVKTRDLRTLLRKMARDGRLNREIVAGNRERWVWEGPKDPEVQKIIDAYDAGELEADKQEKLAALKSRKEEQRKAKADAAAKAEAEAPSDDEELEA